MSTTSEIAKNFLAIDGASVATIPTATCCSIDPWGIDPNINASLLRAAAARLDELERENAELREALVKSEDILRRAEIDSELDALCVIRAALHL